MSASMVAIYSPRLGFSYASRIAATVIHAELDQPESIIGGCYFFDNPGRLIPGTVIDNDDLMLAELLQGSNGRNCVRNIGCLVKSYHDKTGQTIF